MKIHIHVGVHKTATSFIQDRLQGNLAKLNRAGIGYMPVASFRTSNWMEPKKLDPTTFHIEDHLRKFFPRGMPKDVQGLVISDEKLMGLCGALVTTGKLFNGVRTRMMHLRQLFEGHEVTLYCALRRYDTFLASAYCEGLRSTRRYVTFEDFTSRVIWKGVNWAALLQKLEASLQPHQVRYWRYEQFRPNAEAVLQDLAFGQTLEKTEAGSGKTTYPSFSQAAVDALDSIAERLGGDVAGALVRPVSVALSKNDGYPDFDPWGPADKTRLAKRYDEDCRAISREKWLLQPAYDETPVQARPAAA